MQRGVNATGVFFTNALKEQMVSHFALLCDTKEAHLIDDDAQKEELKAYTYTFTKTGKVSYHHPQGGHDDLVTMLLLLYRDYHAALDVLPFVGILLGARRGVSRADRPTIHQQRHN